MKKIICSLLLLSVMLVGCEKDEDEDAITNPTTDPKVMKSVWIDGAFTLDLTNAAFGGSQFSINVADPGGSCDCDMTLVGNNSAGASVVTNCAISVGTPVTCSLWEGAFTGQYENTGTTLTFEFSGLDLE